MRGIFLVLILVVGFCLCTLAAVSEIKKPNIIIILADDLGWNDVGYHGSDIHTPEIDNLANNGIQLNRFYACPVCTPTRAGLLTGKYPDRFGMRNGVCAPTTLNGLPPEETTLAEYLEQKGYKNRAAFGKWHLGHSHVKYHPLNQGFTYFYGHYNGAIDYFTRKRDAELDWHRNFDAVFEEGYSTDLIGEDVVRYIDEKHNEGPFFAYIAFNAPHSPMQAKEVDLLKYGYDPDIQIEDYPIGGQRVGERESDIYGRRGRGNTLRQTFSAMVSAMDLQIGNIISYLRENDLYENTFIWFLSDNGGVYRFGGDNTPLRGQKHEVWEGGVRTVSIVKPHYETEVKKINQVISYIDIFPTLVQITDGIVEQTIFDGINVNSSFKGNHLPKRYLFLGRDAIVSDQWKLINDQLFQIDVDPEESENVKEKFQSIYDEMKNRMEEFKIIEKGEYIYQPEGWNPPENWKMPEK